MMPATMVRHPLSFSEEIMWLAERRHGEAVAFAECPLHMPTVLRLRGPLDARALGDSLRDCVARHELLRAVYRRTDAGVRRMTCDRLPAALPMTDLQAPAENERATLAARVAEAARVARVAMPWRSSHERHLHAALPDDGLAARAVASDAAPHETGLRDAASCETALRAGLAAEIDAPFDLGAGPPYRARLFRVGPADHVFSMTVHHIAFDAWSREIFLAELRERYAAHVRRQPLVLPPLDATYADYVRRQRDRLDEPRSRRLALAWRRQLRDAPIVCAAGRSAPPVRVAPPAGLHLLTLDAGDADRLRQISRANRVTVAIAMLALLNLLLYDSTGQRDLIVGLPATDRPRVAFESVIGLFLNMLIVRTALSEAMPFEALLAQVRERLSAAYLHSDVPYGWLLRESPAAAPSVPPPVRVVFNFATAGGRVSAPWTELDVTGLATEFQRVSIADLSLHVYDGPRALSCELLYRADLFPPARIEALARRLAQLASRAAATPGADLQTLCQIDQSRILA